MPPRGTRSWSAGLAAAGSQSCCASEVQTQDPRPHLPVLWCHGFRSARGAVISPEQKLAGPDIQGPGFQCCLWPKTLTFRGEGGGVFSFLWELELPSVESSAAMPGPNSQPAAAPFPCLSRALPNLQSQLTGPLTCFYLGRVLPPAPSPCVNFPALGVLLAKGCPEQTG